MKTKQSQDLNGPAKILPPRLLVSPTLVCLQAPAERIEVKRSTATFVKSVHLTINKHKWKCMKPREQSMQKYLKEYFLNKLWQQGLVNKSTKTLAKIFCKMHYYLLRLPPHSATQLVPPPFLHCQAHLMSPDPICHRALNE